MRVQYNFSSRRTGHIENIAKQREKFPNVVRNMLRICDVILEVLDARFIDDTRNEAVEKLVIAKGKTLIFVINKVDLVNENKLRAELKEKGLMPFVLVSCKNRRGSRELRARIKMEVHKADIPHIRANVGIVGYPNTGKSSLINFLTGRGAAKTASEAGFTRGMQRIRLSSDIHLLDTPGVIPDKDYSHSKQETVAKHAKIGARTYDSVKDPDYAVSELLLKYAKPIADYYGIEASENSEIFLDALAKKKGLLVKGGLPDIDRASRFILKDWQQGKIRIRN